MKKNISGKAYVLGDNIDTDQIIPAEHLVYSLTDEEESKKYGEYALSAVPLSKAGLPNGGIPFVKKGETQSDFNIIIGGSNFGCGSSREHAPFAMQKAGVQIVIAESYARIFYRNAIDGGFLVPFESKIRLIDKIKTGTQVEVDLENNILTIPEDGTKYQLKALGDVLPIVEAGGLFEYARKTGMVAS